MAQYTHVTPEDIFRNEEVRAYIQQGNDNLGVIGYTEHGFAHAKKSSDTAREILRALGYPQRDCERAAIARRSAWCARPLATTMRRPPIR